MAAAKADALMLASLASFISVFFLPIPNLQAEERANQGSQYGKKRRYNL